jgi:hypothetical protein
LYHFSIQALILVPDALSADELQDMLIETPNGIQALDSGLTPPTTHIVQRRFRPSARNIDQRFEPQTLANLESMLLRMKESKEANVQELLFEDVVPTTDFMKDWPEEVTIEYHDGRPVLVTDLGSGAGVIDVRAPAQATSGAAAPAPAHSAPVQKFEPLAMLPSQPDFSM